MSTRFVPPDGISTWDYVTDGYGVVGVVRGAVTECASIVVWPVYHIAGGRYRKLAITGQGECFSGAKRSSFFDNCLLIPASSLRILVRWNASPYQSVRSIVPNALRAVESRKIVVSESSIQIMPFRSFVPASSNLAGSFPVGEFALPQAMGRPDWVMGSLTDWRLSVPECGPLPAEEALERVW